MARLYEIGIGRAAFGHLDLLLEVARHKEVYFPAAWASYATARPGSLHLLPPASRMAELQREEK